MHECKNVYDKLYKIASIKFTTNSRLQGSIQTLFICCLQTTVRYHKILIYYTLKQCSSCISACLVPITSYKIKQSYCPIESQAFSVSRKALSRSPQSTFHLSIARSSDQPQASSTLPLWKNQLYIVSKCL